MSTETPQQFFNLYFPTPIANQFIKVAEKELARGSSCDKAIELAFEQADLKIPRFSEGWALVNELGNEEIEETSQMSQYLSGSHKLFSKAEDYSEGMIGIADARIGAELLNYQMHLKVVNSLVSSLPDDLPANQLSHLMASYIMPVSKVYLSSNISFSLSAEEKKEQKQTKDLLDQMGELSSKVLAFIKVLLTAIGIEALFDLIVGDGAIMKKFLKLWKALLKKDLSLAITIMEEIIDLICGKKFRQKIMRKVGKKQAAKLFGKLFAKLVPFLGWALLAATIIYALYENWDEIIDP